MRVVMGYVRVQEHTMHMCMVLPHVVLVRNTAKGEDINV